MNTIDYSKATDWLMNSDYIKYHIRLNIISCYSILLLYCSDVIQYLRLI